MLEEMHPLHPEQSAMLNSIVQDFCGMDGGGMCPSNGSQENVKQNCIWRWDMVDMSAKIWMQHSDGFEVSLF